MARKDFNETDLALIERLWAEGLSLSVIAERTGRHIGVLTRVMGRDRERFPKRGARPGRALSEETVAAAAAMWADGVKVEEMAERLGMSRDSVIAMANRRRKRFPKRGLPPGNKLSEEIIEAAAAMWADGVKVNDMAARLGLTRNSVIKIANRNRARFPLREASVRQTARVRARAEIAAFKAAPKTKPEPPAVPVVSSQMDFLHAVDQNRCLFACTDGDGPCGPDMQVCGAPRLAGADHFTRYCAFHVRLSIGRGTPGERNAHRSLIWAAGADAFRVPA